MLVRCFYETIEERMRTKWLRSKFRVELDGNVPGMGRQFENFHKFSVWRPPGDAQSVFSQNWFEFRIEFIPMPVTFMDDVEAVGFMCNGIGF